MPNLDSYSGRVAYCLALLALEEGVPAIRHDELAARIEPVRQKRYPVATIGRWLKRWPGDEEDMVALAEVLRVDPGWLFFGPERTAAPGPTDAATHTRRGGSSSIDESPAPHPARERTA